jgi:DNA-binding MarR family transcriptional regulator
MHWTDTLHRQLIAIADLVSRFDVDARLLLASGVKLDRALFPLLSRIELHSGISSIELANLVGRDHSTVSRQVAKLDEQGLITRTPDTKDRRIRRLSPTPAGKQLIERIRGVRREWIERHFNEWSDEEREQLLTSMAKLLENGPKLFVDGN